MDGGALQFAPWGTRPTGHWYIHPSVVLSVLLNTEHDSFPVVDTGSAGDGSADTGSADEGGTDTGPADESGTDTGPTADGCAFDYTEYGAEDCDAAWDIYGLDCATLADDYTWDCSGCTCPGDAP